MFGQGFDSPRLHQAPLWSAFDCPISSGQSIALKANLCSLDGIQTLVLRALGANQITANSPQFSVDRQHKVDISVTKQSYT